jgi:PAS domain S-box-containing protein
MERRDSASTSKDQALREQRQWFEVTLSCIGDGVITTDTEGNVTFLNSVAEKMTGWATREAQGCHLEKVFPIIDEDTREPVENPALLALKEGVVYGLSNHTLLITKDGREIAIDDSGAPIVAGDKQIGAVLVFRDTSERRQAERARALLAKIVESSEDAIVSKTLDGIITSWNAAAERMFEYTAEEAVGKPITIIIPKDRLSEEDYILGNLRQGKRIFHMDTIRVTKSGKLRNISLSVSPVRDGNGKIIGASKIARDITERVRAERELQRLLASESAARAQAESARQQAEAASRAKDEFLATISHEIRSPLNAILGWSQILNKTGLDEETLSRASQSIERNARAQVQLLSDLLDISRVITGKLKINSHPVEVRTALDAALESMRAAAEAKSLTIEVRELDEHAIVSGDPERLQQVFWNLLSNAVKFTPTHGHIAITVQRTSFHVEIIVKDSGVGIETEFLPYVFDRFTQADTGSTRQHQGLGLGLAIVRHLVELHGGSVHASSDGEGKGSTFGVSLPIRPRSEEIAKDVAALNTQGLDDLADRIALAKLKVLIVDDERDARELLSAMLSAKGAEVKTVSSAKEALDEIRKWRPSILVSDICMPGEDGYALIRRVRKLADVGRVPAVALTAYARAEDRLRALAAGFQAHVAKPVEASELLMVIASLTDRTVR